MPIAPRPIVARNPSDRCPSCNQSIEVCFGPVCAKATGGTTAENIAKAAFACVLAYGVYRAGQHFLGA